MAIDKKLLEILVCPASKVPVTPLTKDRLAILNQCIDKGEVKRIDGSSVQGALSEALITTDDNTIYVVDNGIPIMLEEQGISASQVPGW